MQQDERLSKISERLQNLTIHEVRQLARALSVPFDSAHKSKVIEAVLDFAQGKIDPKLRVKGAPPKSDKHDEALAAEVIAYRESVLSVDFGAESRGSISVADSESALKKQVCGILFKADGEYFLRTDGGDAHVAQSFLSRYLLRVGDEVEGVAQWRAQEKAWALILVEKVGGQNAGDLGARSDFCSLTRQYPTKRIVLSHSADAACKITDMFAPLALGQRAVISSPAKGGKTTLIKKYAQALVGFGGEVVILLLNAKPEEICDFKQVFAGNRIFSTSFDMTEGEHLGEAALAFEYAKRKVECGKDIIILADGLTSAGTDAVKRLTSNSCCAAEGGSLTVIYTLPQTFGGYDELIDTANAVIALSGELAQSRIFPAINAKACLSNREEELLSSEEAAAATALRRRCVAEEIIEIFKSADYGDILKKYKNG